MTPLHSLELVRDRVGFGRPTTGEVLVEGIHFCDSLEPPWLENRRGVSCIPPGVYELALTLSTRFGREMPRVIGVPGRTGILFHGGDTVEDTEGCVLLGEGRTPEAFAASDSRAVLRRFVEWLRSVGGRARLTVRAAA